MDLAGTTGSVLAATTSVVNDGVLDVSSILAQDVGAVSGIGVTQVDANANLTAASIVQDTLTIGAGGSVTIRETSGGAEAVPEPSTFVLLGMGAVGLLAYAYQHRNRPA